VGKMRKNRFSPTRADAVADLRAGFAGVYNELRHRGHEVIVDYADPANPLYIPQLVELDTLNRSELNLRFFIAPNLVEYPNGRSAVEGNYWGVMYLPTSMARHLYCERKKERSTRLSKNQLNGSALAEWVEKLLDVEQRVKRRVAEEQRLRCELRLRTQHLLDSGEISSR
jgi:hypothetical protein